MTRSPCFQGIEGREPNAEMAVFEPSISGGQRAHVKSCGQSVGTAQLTGDPTPASILLKSSESVSFPLDTVALNVLVGSGKPLTTAVPTSEKERDGTKRNGPDRDRPRRTSIWPKMAVTVGFEPTVGGYPTQLFESCTFGRSDTSPPTSLRHAGGCRESAQHLRYSAGDAGLTRRGRPRGDTPRGRAP